MIHTGWPRQVAMSKAPGSSLLMSWVTGAPATCARALGCQDLMNGTARNAAPTPPTTAVVAVRNRRRLLLTSCSAIRVLRPKASVFRGTDPCGPENHYILTRRLHGAQSNRW